MFFFSGQICDAIRALAEGPGYRRLHPSGAGPRVRVQLRQSVHVRDLPRVQGARAQRSVQRTRVRYLLKGRD